MSSASVTLVLLDEQSGDGLNARQKNGTRTWSVASGEHVGVGRPNADVRHGLTPCPLRWLDISESRSISFAGTWAVNALATANQSVAEIGPWLGASEPSTGHEHIISIRVVLFMSIVFSVNTNPARLTAKRLDGK